VIKNFKLKILIGFCSLAFVGCAVSSTNQVVKPGEQKGGFMGLSKNPEVMVDNPGALKELPTKVIIGSFKVGFIMDNKARATAKGGFFSASTGAGHATAIVHLKGLSHEDLQKITNDIYKNFMQSLQAKGYTVVPAEELASNAAYNDLQAAGVASPEEGVVLNVAQEAKTTYMAPDGMKLVYYIGEKKAMFDISTATIQKAQALSDSSSAAVLAVNYLVNFAGADAQGGWVSSASVNVGQGLRIGLGHVNVYNGKTKAAVIKLGQPVYSEKEFCTIEKTTSAAAKTIGIGLNVASTILGGGTSQEETFDFKANPQAYTEAAVDVGSRTNGKLVDQLAASK
jgi:hypothetical protein